MARELSLEQCRQASVYNGIIQMNYDAYCTAYGVAIGKDASRVTMADLLCPVFDPECYECDANGRVHFYRQSTHGGYLRDSGGDFVRVIFLNDDGMMQEVFLHYAQIYKPVELVRDMINTVFIALAVSYEYYQTMVAELNSYAKELEELTSQLRQLNTNFARLSSHNSNYKVNGDDFELFLYGPDFWEPLVNAGVVDLHHLAITDVEPPLLAVEFKTTEINLGNDASDWYVALFNFIIDSSGNLAVKTTGGYWLDGRSPGHGRDEYNLRSKADSHRQNNFTTLDNKIKFLFHDEPLHFSAPCPSGSWMGVIISIVKSIFSILKGIFTGSEIEVSIHSRYMTSIRGDKNDDYDEDDARHDLLYYKLYDTSYHYEIEDKNFRPVSKIRQGEGVEHFSDYLNLTQRIDTRKYTIKTPINKILESKDLGASKVIYSFIAKREIKSFTDKIRSAIDSTNSIIGGASNALGAVAQRFSQAFTMASELIETTGSHYAKTTRNVR
ncbi:MAG: hypothetical protein LBI69_04260 [Puniceicoccales bacterium]|jgi:hypothetical protein|nr:hypothetical protein [Puniceicoccales bacterium]